LSFEELGSLNIYKYSSDYFPVKFLKINPIPLWLFVLWKNYKEKTLAKKHIYNHESSKKDVKKFETANMGFQNVMK